MMTPQLSQPRRQRRRRSQPRRVGSGRGVITLIAPHPGVDLADYLKALGYPQLAKARDEGELETSGVIRRISLNLDGSLRELAMFDPLPALEMLIKLSWGNPRGFWESTQQREAKARYHWTHRRRWAEWYWEHLKGIADPGERAEALQQVARDFDSLPEGYPQPLDAPPPRPQPERVWPQLEPSSRPAPVVPRAEAPVRAQIDGRWVDLPPN